LGKVKVPAGPAALPPLVKAAFRLETQALAALGPAAVDNGLAALGPHPHQETVSAFSSEIMGLKSPFHNEPRLIY
jgi:hypothetical protein